MTIAAHITDGNLFGSSFLTAYLPQLAAQHPQHHFIFFTEQPLQTTAVANITQVSISPAIKNSLLLHYWYNFKLPVLLKKYNASVFISEINVLPLKIKITSILLIHNVPQVKKSSIFKNNYKRYLQKYFSRSLKKTNSVVCTAHYLEKELISKFNFAKQKTTCIHPPIHAAFKPIPWQQKENTLQQYSGEKDYFLYPVSLITKENILPALKAFSLFKKWHKSSMKLVLLSGTDMQDTMLVKDFDLYKYKDDVAIIFTDNKKEVANITASAYAMIYLPQHAHIEYFALEAMQAEVPVITCSNQLTKDMYGQAVIYTGINGKDNSESMIHLYKDENLRNEMIKKGVLHTAGYSDKDFFEPFWEVITKAVEG